MPTVIDDRSRLSPICMFCSRLRSIDKRQCDAFPRAIPAEIWNGRDAHQKPVRGDGGLRFNWIDQPDGRESNQTI